MSIFDAYENDEMSDLSRDEELDYSHVSESEADGEVEQPTSRLPIARLHVILGVLVIGILVTRLLYIQIFQGRQNATLAREHSVRQIPKPAPRGAVLDSRGVWLARNTSSFRVQVLPSDLPHQKAERQKIYDALGVALGWNDEEKTKWIARFEDKKILYTLIPVPVRENIAHDDALVLFGKLDAVQSVSVIPQSVRQYNDPMSGLSHILGYVSEVTQDDIEATGLHRGDTVGKTGLESNYDTDLRGKDGVQQAVVDSKGKVLQVLQDKSQDSQPGSNLVLHLDLKLQQIMAEELKNGLEKAHIPSGVAIAMDPSNGAILGMVSLPTYDNNIFANGIDQNTYQSLVNDPNKPLFDRSVLGTFATGSTVKPMVAAIGLQEGVITEKTSLDTPAEIVIGDSHFPNWQRFFIPNVDVKTAIAKSNDIFFYAVGGGWDKVKGLGIDRLAKGLGLFGFGERTGIDLPGEAAGVVPNPDWKQLVKKESWRLGDTYHLSIGQGDFLATPLQLVSALSAIANNGTLYQPQLADRLTDTDGHTIKTFEPKVIRKDFIDQDHIRTVRDGMRQAVTDGSGRQLQSLPVDSGAKTGTAQLGASNEFLHSWFEAFAPFTNPKIAIVVLGERGSQENEGNTTAEPIAKNILERYFSPDFSK